MPEIGVTIKGVPEALKMLEDIQAVLIDPAPMQGMCDDVKTKILMNTALGLDYQGKSFEPYSEQYGKKKMGQTATGRPNLKVTGTMLDSIQAKAFSHEHGEVRVTNEELIAQLHNQGGPKSGCPPKREFMNVTKNFILTLVKKWFDDPLMKIIGRR
jgi:hypothetical protein